MYVFAFLDMLSTTTVAVQLVQLAHIQAQTNYDACAPAIKYLTQTISHVQHALQIQPRIATKQLAYAFLVTLLLMAIVRKYQPARQIKF
jgi:hypothetical protein